MEIIQVYLEAIQQQLTNKNINFKMQSDDF